MEQGETMNKRALEQAVWMAVTAVAGLGLLAWACRPPQDRREACLEEGLADLSTWRWVEPRLSGGFTREPCEKVLPPGHAVEVARCPSPHRRFFPVSLSAESCDSAGSRHVEALRTLILRPERIDEVVEMLEALVAESPTDARLRSDLAAVYLVRAQRADRPSDLLRSLEAAQWAAAGTGRPPEAQFNLGLAQEVLHLSSAALHSWNEYLQQESGSPWAGEARERRRRLRSVENRAAATRWPLNKQRLADAVRFGDRAAIARLIAPFPAAAQRHLEEEVIPAWARDLSQGRREAAEKHLIAAQMIAKELGRSTGDPYLVDAVDLLSDESRRVPEGARLRTLLEGHLAFGEARHAQEAHQWQEAERYYRRAQELLRQAGSPLGAGAELGSAIALYEKADEGSLLRALHMLASLEKEAREHRYGLLLGRILWMRGLFLYLLNRPIESLAAFNQSLNVFGRLQDGEDVVNVRTRKTGVLRILGEGDLAWREAYQALRQFADLTELQARHHLLGEAASSARAVGHFRIGLLYQDEAVQLIEEELATVSSEGDEEAWGLRVNLAIALQERAALQLQGERLDQAQIDLAESSRLAEEHADPGIQRVLQARIREVEGDAFLGVNPQQATEAFTEALELLPSDRFRTFRASILFKRALAFRKLESPDEAERDLVAGLGELRREADEILAKRRPGEGEELWGGYFARFQAAYKLLIRLLVEDGRHREAFSYVEEARAFEPLDLVSQLPSLPETFRRLIEPRGHLSLEQVQEHLPEGTFLIEICVLEDRVFLWILWRDGFDFVTRSVDRPTLESWTGTIQRAARYRSAGGLASSLASPYLDLISPWLEPIAEAHGAERLVFVPDGPLHGLPMAALRDPATGRYLIEDFTVSSAPSATLYVFSLLRDAKLSRERLGGILLVGDPAFDPALDIARGMERLESARQEVERIGRLYRPMARPLTGREATAGRFFSLAGASTVVHIAGHAIVNPRIPSRSFLLLSPSGGHSGAVSAEELVTSLRFPKTRLFVLSACSSAGGQPPGSEGLAALVRPLLAAGVPAVVGSLWDVPDATTEELLVNFHRRYSAGEDAAGALRGAQLDLLHKGGGGLSSALAWAPFEVIGYAGSPFAKNLDKKKENSP